MTAAPCSSCGAHNLEGSRFCGSCGAELQPTPGCARCGASGRPGQRFCTACGHPFEAMTGSLPTRPPGAAAPRSRASGLPAPASLAKGRYDLRRFLGEGSRKSVYLAHDQRLDRAVAVALLKVEGLDEVGLERARREAQAMGRLGHHPNVVTVFDVGEEAGCPYIVTEFIDGGSVSQLLHEAPGGRLALQRTLEIAIDLCAGLEHAHSLGIVHRDLKPANVWLTQEGVAKLGDFGLAVAIDRSRLTQEGTILGTVAYMSPEQALGREADARSDLYSLGAILYEMTTGRTPFKGDDVVSVISQHLNTPPVAPSWHNRAVPQPFEALILRLLAKTPDERPGSVSEVRKALEALASGSAPPPSEVRRQANPLDPLASRAFVGRRQEMGRLKRALEQALAGRGRLVLLTGEPGIGKTRITQELATYAQLRGAEVLVGRCYEGRGAPSFWPWVQIVRSYVSERDASELLAKMGPGAADVGQVVPELRERLPELATPPALEAEQARFRFFDSMAAFLKTASRERPLLLLLDDLHWADKPSVLLLEFLTREMQAERLMILGTYRDVELGRDSPLSEALPNLRREPLHERIALSGLPEEDVRELLSKVGEQIVPPAFVHAIASETEGNPFFVLEVLRHLVEERILYRNAAGQWTSDVSPERMGIPEGILEVIGRRLGRLSDPCRELLRVASAIGREIDRELLERVAERDGDAVLEALEEAETARVLEVTSGASRRHRFSHALIRETLYEGLSTARRVSLHRRIGSALEELYADDIDSHLAELAHHYYEAAPSGETEKAIRYSTHAATRASQMLAWEDAATQYEHAVEALSLQDPADPQQRCELVLLTGEAYVRGGAVEVARERFLLAAELARELGSAERLARAALGTAYFHLRSLGVRTGVVDGTLIALLQEALDSLEAGDSALRSLLLGQLAMALYYTSTPKQRSALAEEAVAMARRLRDPATLAAALHAHHAAAWGPGNVRQRLADASEIIELAEQLGDKELALLGHSCRSRDLLETGDIAAVDAEHAAANALAEELRQPLYLWAGPQHAAGRALLEGRFADAERLIAAAFARGQRLKAVQSMEAYAAQSATLRRETQGIQDLLPAFEAFVERSPALPAWRCALANACLVAGEMERARELYDGLAEHDFEELPHDVFWLLGICLIAQVCHALADAKHAERLYDLLEPYEDVFVVMGMWAGAVYGCVPHYRGLLATTLQRWERAEAHFEEALVRHEAIRSGPLLAHTQFEFARMLFESQPETHRERARRLLDQALDTAQRLGMKVLIDRALPLKLALQGIEPTSKSTLTSIYAVASSVEAHGPDLRPHAAPDGTVTLMFSDMQGFSSMTERLGDLEARRVIELHNRIVRSQLAAHRGYEVELQGDGFLLAFSSARLAALCAIAIQRDFAEHSRRHPEAPIRVRIGMHTGEALRDARKFFGRTVIQACRIADQAQAREVMVSSLLRELLLSAGDMAFGEPREVELKGLSGTYRLYPLLWEQTPDGPPEPAPPGVSP